MANKKNSKKQNTEVKLELPPVDTEITQKFNLVMYHDGLDVTTVFINNVINKFKAYFKTIYLILEDDIDISILKEHDNLTVVSSLRPINLGAEWVLILEPGEFPSIQLLNGLGELVSNLDSSIKIIKLPLVVCHFATGKIIDVMEPAARLFRQNTQLLQGQADIKEEIMDDFPLVKLYVDFDEISASSN